MFFILTELENSAGAFIHLLAKNGVFRLIAKRVISLSGLQRRFILFFLDSCLIILSILFAFYLRFDGIFPEQLVRNYTSAAIGFTFYKLLCFYFSGLYRPLLRYSALEVIDILLKATILSEFSLLIANSLSGFVFLPRSVQLISGLISFLAISSARLILRFAIQKIDIFSFRYYRLKQKTHNSLKKSDHPQRNVVIYGAGQAGAMLAKTIDQNQQYNVVAFIDDDPALKGRNIGVIPIFSIENFQELVSSYEVSLILLAIPSAAPQQRQEILQRFSGLSIEVRTVPTLEELALGRVSIEETRRIQVSDLLGREEAAADPVLMRKNIFQHSVLVTGAGGSIGSELCRQVAQQSPQVLVLYEISEFALYSIQMEISEKYPTVKCVPCLGSVTDPNRLREILSNHKVETVYHAAAYKHVPLVESNPAQGVLNNVYGTFVAAKVSKDCQVKTFVLISTDKAVRPTNVMGATKRAAELVLQSLSDNDADAYTKFIMVRFGNVLGSSGSVVPRFRKQIEKRQSITITHPDITRYFMSIPEAARLVIQASSMAKGGEVFLLEMGEPVKIYDLAVQMIELSGLQVGKEIDIDIVGLRPGEKLYEELLIDESKSRRTAHPKIYAANESMIPWSALESQLEELFNLAEQHEILPLIQKLKSLIPEYEPQKELLERHKKEKVIMEA